MRQYLQASHPSKAPYTVQFALECLGRPKNRREKKDRFAKTYIDENLTIECPKCHALLYTTNFNSRQLACSTRGADDFKPIGDQPKVTNREVAPACIGCGALWIWNDEDLIEISTTQGVLSYDKD